VIVATIQLAEYHGGLEVKDSAGGLPQLETGGPSNVEGTVRMSRRFMLHSSSRSAINHRTHVHAAELDLLLKRMRSLG